MKFLIIDIYYDGFLKKFYKSLAGIDLGYEENKHRIMRQLFGTADYYSKNLNLIGNISEDIIYNDKILQNKWVKEHGQVRFLDWLDGAHIPFTKIGFHSHWQNEILEQQILDYKPDIIYCQSLYDPGSVFLNRVKKITGAFIVGQVAFQVNFDKELLFVYDLILTSFPHFVPRFKSIGINSEYFRIGFETSILPKLKEMKKQYPVTFVGSFSRRHDNESVLAVATDVWGHGLVPKTSKYHGEAWGIDMYNILYNSKITLNRHISTAENHSNNMRLYEATGVGTMLITDYKDDLHKLFEIGKEVETYKTKEELINKVNYYLTHDKEREKIAKAGQKRTLKDHTYKHRMEELVKILNKYV